MKRIIRHIPSLLLGVSFVTSGWLKGVDPYGTSLKLSEYFRVWGWNGFVADISSYCIFRKWKDYTCRPTITRNKCFNEIGGTFK